MGKRVVRTRTRRGEEEAQNSKPDCLHRQLLRSALDTLSEVVAMLARKVYLREEKLVVPTSPNDRRLSGPLRKS
jgi:hypothetical protein